MLGFSLKAEICNALADTALLTFDKFAGIVGAANQTGCIVLRVGNLADYKL
jgi:hypothetical protein